MIGTDSKQQSKDAPLPSRVTSRLNQLKSEIDHYIGRVLDACEPEDVPEAARQIGKILWEAKLQ